MASHTSSTDANRNRSSTTASSQTQTSPVGQQTLWQKTKKNSKASFDRLWGYADKLGAPVNKLSNKLGSEAFWPTNLGLESEKAARIIRSFCKDGFYEEEKVKTAEGPTAKQRVLKKIPSEVIANAKGLAVFTTMRTGLWISGAGGSGVLVARKEDGSWSPPVGIMLHTAGLGFLIGVDIYDCVLVLNTDKAVQAFSKWRCTLGGEISAVAGPVGMGGILETELHARQAPVFTYLKSRGFYAAVQMDGTVIIERSDENERFYGERLSATEILSGKAQSRQWELRVLMETLKSAQGDRNFDRSLVPTEPPPADYEVVEDGHVFGIPDSEDPDPYGVLALEKQGMVIKEAGTKQEAHSEDFDFKPSHTSPVYSVFKKNFDSTSVGSQRNSWRGSTLSSGTTHTFTDRPKYASQDMATQTDIDLPTSPTRASAASIKEEDLLPSPPGSAGVEVRNSLSNGRPENDQVSKTEEAGEDGEDGEEDAEVIQHVQQHVQQAPHFVKKPKMVAVGKRVPPPLPPRNPGRMPSATATPDTQSIAESSQDAVVSPSVEKASPDLVQESPDLTAASRTLESATAETAEHIPGTSTHGAVNGTKDGHDDAKDDHGEDAAEGESSGEEDYDEEAEEHQVVTAVSAKMTQIRKFEPTPAREGETAKPAPVTEVAEEKSIDTTTMHTLEPPTPKAATHSATEETAPPEQQTASAASDESVAPLPPHPTADDLPGAFPADPAADTLAAPAEKPSVPPRSAARPPSKSPARSRVSMAGIRDSLSREDADDDEDDEDDDEDDAADGHDEQRTGRARTQSSAREIASATKHEHEDDFS